MDEKELDEEMERINKLKLARENISKNLRMLIDDELLFTEEKYNTAKGLLNIIYIFDSKIEERRANLIKQV